MKEKTQAEIERNERQLNRMMTIIDVLFALILFQVFMILPRPEIDNFTISEFRSVLIGNSGNYLVLLVGLVMVIIYWGQNNLQYGNLKRTDSKHAALAIIQIFCLLVYMYFVRFDVQFDGPVLALQLESVFLALAGFISVYSWHYAVKHNLVSDQVDEEEIKSTYRKLWPEPVVASLSFPFAQFGPDIWTLSWLLLIPVSMIVKRRYKPNKVQSS